MDALGLLSGDAQTFVEKVWASHIHLHQASPDALVSLLSLDDVDHLLTSTALRAPALRVAKDGSVLPTSSFTRGATLGGAPLTGLVDARKVLDLFDGGATVVLQGLHRYWPPLTQLVRSLERSLGHPCQANAYLTPPASQGFAVHSDSHDVFVFQTYGHKHWQVHDESGQREVMLEPGVSMYLPTGTPHAARAQDETSLHVTIGINQVTWREVLSRMTAQVMADEMYDDRLPAGYLDDPATLAGAVRERLTTLTETLAGLDPDTLAAEEIRRFLSSRNPELRRGLRDRAVLDKVDDRSRLSRRPGAVCVVQREADRLRLLLGDRQLTVPSRLAEPLDYILDTSSLQPKDLAAWLDEPSRLVLVRRLVREGLLQVES